MLWQTLQSLVKGQHIELVYYRVGALDDLFLTSPSQMRILLLYFPRTSLPT
jgi:hypothetical protein